MGSGSGKCLSVKPSHLFDFAFKYLLTAMGLGILCLTHVAKKSSLVQLLYLSLCGRFCILDILDTENAVLYTVAKQRISPGWENLKGKCQFFICCFAKLAKIGQFFMLFSPFSVFCHYAESIYNLFFAFLCRVYNPPFNLFEILSY